MNKENILSVIGTILVILLIAFYMVEYGDMVSKSQTITPGIPTNQAGNNSITLTPAEVAKHGSTQSCWFIIDSKVYDVTSYPMLHPGGAANIVNFCGKDATQAFATKGGKGSHSQSASADLSAFYIGDLNAQINTQIINNVSSTPVVNTGWRNEEADD
jgi:cytochrome b involved in lipid metabolism